MGKIMLIYNQNYLFIPLFSGFCANDSICFSLLKKSIIVHVNDNKGDRPYFVEASKWTHCLYRLLFCRMEKIKTHHSRSHQ